MHVYDVLDVGKWRGVFEKVFPYGHMKPLPTHKVLTPELCKRFGRSIYAAIVKQEALGEPIELYSWDGEPLSLEVGEAEEVLCLPAPPDDDVPELQPDDMIRYVLDSWFSAMRELEEKGKLPELLFSLTKEVRGKDKGAIITYDPTEGLYRAVIVPKGLYSVPTQITWNTCHLTLRVGTRELTSTGMTKLMKDMLEVPTRYVILTYLRQVASRVGLEYLGYGDYNLIMQESFLWLDANSFGDTPVYGMNHPLDSTAYVREANRGLYLQVTMRDDKKGYPFFTLRKFSPTEVESGEGALAEAHNKGETLVTEKNGGVSKSMISNVKGVNNCFVGVRQEPDGSVTILNYLADEKVAKMLARIHSGTGGNKAQMTGIEGSNIFIRNKDGTLTRHYGYPVDYFVCMGRGFGGNSGVVPVSKEFHIPYKVRKRFMDTVYVDDIPRGSEIEARIIQRAKAYGGTTTPGSMERALADYIREKLSKEVLEGLKDKPNRTWKDEYLLTLFNVGRGCKPLKVFRVSGNNRRYRFPEGGTSLDEMVQVGVGCVYIVGEMYFEGTKGEPFKLRMLGGKATTLPCEFDIYTKEEGQLVPFPHKVDVLMTNECMKGRALWWIAYAQLNGPCYLDPNTGLMEIGPTGEVVDFLQPNNPINKWLEENAQEVFIEYELNNEVLNVLRQEAEFFQDIGQVNPNADIEVVELVPGGAKVRERVVGIHARIPLGYVELSTAAEKVNASTLTSQQFAGLGMLNPKLLQGLVEASAWKRDMVEKMIQIYVGGGSLSRYVSGGKTHQLFLPILKHLIQEVKCEDPSLEAPEMKQAAFRLAFSKMEEASMSSLGVMNLMNSVYPSGFLLDYGSVQVPICFPILQVYANRDSINPTLTPLTGQVLSVVRQLLWAFLEDARNGISSSTKWEHMWALESDPRYAPMINRLNAGIQGWVRRLLGDPSATSKVLATLGRITSCAQATLKTSHLPSAANQWEKDSEGNTHPIPVFYIHPDDDILRILFGDKVPEDTDKNPYFIACTRTPLGFWMFGRLIISKEHGWVNHITCNCVGAQIITESDGDGDMFTVIPVTMYDPSISYRDVATYNASYLGGLGYGLQGKESTLVGFFEAKSKWGPGKHVFRSKHHPLLPVTHYPTPDFVGVVPGHSWGSFTTYAQRHYRVNVGAAYGAYSNVCFAASKYVEDFRELCYQVIPCITNTEVIEYLNDTSKVSGIAQDARIPQRYRHALIGKAREAVVHLCALAITSRIMYEGMGLSGFTPKAFSGFSLYLALVNNPKGLVVPYWEPSFSSDYYLYFNATNTQRKGEVLEAKHLAKTPLREGELVPTDGVRQLIACLFPKEVRAACEGNAKREELVYDPLYNSFNTYTKGLYPGLYSEVVGLVLKAGLWGVIHRNMLRGRQQQPGLPEDLAWTILTRVLRDFTSGSIGGDVYTIMDAGVNSSVSLTLWNLLNTSGSGWDQVVKELVPNTQLRSMMMRALPLIYLVYLYKQNQVLISESVG